jgi:dipeptidyl aminopeptidase/acylaminoacyl peptidase
MAAIIGFALLAEGCASAQPSAVPMLQTASSVLPATATVPPTTTLSPPTPVSPTAKTVPPMLAPTSTPLPPLSASGGGVIAFTSDRSGRSGIYVMNADGSDQRLVTDKDDSSFPAFSPDGSRIVYMSSAPYSSK